MKPKTTRSLSVYSLVALFLIGVLGMLVMKTRAVDFDAYNEILGILRQLKQVDAEWNVDVLRAKTGLAATYDSVASPLPLIASLEVALRGKTGEFWQQRADSKARLLSLLDDYKAAMDRKIRRLAQKRGLSQSALILEAVEALLDASGQPNHLLHFVGVIKGAPPNLSASVDEVVYR